MSFNNIEYINMTYVQHKSKINNVDRQQNASASHRSPIPLMSMIISPPLYPPASPSASRTSISDLTCSSPTPPISQSHLSVASTSTLVDSIHISNFHFAHVIKVPHGTNLLASDNQSTTLCINSIGNIIHLITPTGYHIRSLRWPETETQITDLLWCETLQVYLAITSKSIYTLQYDSNQSLVVVKCLDLPHCHSSSKIFIACNSYRLYIVAQSIDVYTLQFTHLHTKQVPDVINNHKIERFSCSDSFLVFHCKQTTNKLMILDPTTMMIEYEFDLSYQTISSLRCFDENTLVLIGVRQDGENRLIFFRFGNENEASDMQQMVAEKTLGRDEQFVYVLPNCQDLMILNVNTARVQYLKYRC